MPRLGEGTAAYPDQNNKSIKLIRMVVVFFMIFIIRNMFLKDYRSEEINVLRKSGMTQDQIYQYVPPTTDERVVESRKKLSEYEQLKMDVKILKDEVKMLKDKLGITNKIDSQEESDKNNDHDVSDKGLVNSQ
mmetsp:Transcript_4567/g.5946  ORF Transcript_4567/g.5946 Transcript_4567/m.5946 type:complete len:133 (+) Transcript_4567:134-532(+)